MKKLLIAVILYVGMIGNVNAASINFRKASNYICDKDIIYTMYNISDPSTSYFFITPSLNYDLNKNNYYEVSFEDLGIDSSIKDFGGNFTYLYNEGMYSMYSEVITKMIWDYLYKDKNYYFCDINGNEIDNSITSKYDILYQHINKINDGIEEIKKDYYLKENQVYEYEIENINNYYIYDNDNLDISINDKNISVNGPKGTYEVVFKKNPVYFKKTTVLTDGNNYLLSLSELSEKEYHTVFNIGYSKLVVKNNLLKENICYDILKESTLIGNYCTKEDGSFEAYLENGQYTINLVSSISEHDDYAFTKDFLLKDDLFIEHNIDLQQANTEQEVPMIKDEIEPLIETTNDYVSIIPKNTYSFKYLGLLVLLLFGVFLVKKTNK